MEITKEIENIFVRRIENIISIEIEYPNGGTVHGKIKKIRYAPLRITLVKIMDGEQNGKKHICMFDHVTALKINFEEDSSMVFR